jgi:hypothetical protein
MEITKKENIQRFFKMTLMHAFEMYIADSSMS